MHYAGSSYGARAAAYSENCRYHFCFLGYAIVFMSLLWLSDVLSVAYLYVLLLGFTADRASSLLVSPGIPCIFLAELIALNLNFWRKFTEILFVIILNSYHFYRSIPHVCASIR